jgi:hypothetical protein
VVVNFKHFIGVSLTLGAALFLAGCETTDTGPSTYSSGSGAFGQQSVTSSEGNNFITTTSQIDPQTGQRVVTGGSFHVSSDGSTASLFAPMGTWYIRDDYARSCQVSFSNTSLSGSAGARVLDQTGFCSSDFSDARGWMSAGTGFALTNSSGRIIGQFASEGSDSYSGTIDSMFGPRPVKITRR